MLAECLRQCDESVIGICDCPSKIDAQLPAQSIIGICDCPSKIDAHLPARSA